MAHVRGLAGPAAFGLVVLLAGAVACGGGKGSGGTGGTTGGTGPGGTTGSTGPGGTSGGTGPGDTSGGTGSGGGGSGTTAGGGGDSGSGGTSGGGSGGGTSGDGGSGSGGSGSGGGACAALVATLDAGHARRFDLLSNADCRRATSSPNGQVALGILTAGRGTGDQTFHLYPSDGSAEQGTAAVVGDARADIDPWFHWTSVGWAGAVRQSTSGSPYPYSALGSFDDRGNRIRTGADAIATTAPDGHGGTVAVAQAVSSTGFGPPTLEWIDASGNVRRTAALDDAVGLLLVNWSTDHVLVVGSGAAPIRARWYDGSGTPLTPWFAIDASPDSPTLHLLVDGTIALGDVHGWLGVFRDGVAAMDPPPAWLAARPSTRLATIRDGRGYAVLPWHQPRPDLGIAPRQDTFEIVTAAGESCGSVKTPAARDEAGVTRTPTGLEVGQDGTLLESDGLAGASLGNGNHCEFRWWPALLR